MRLNRWQTVGSIKSFWRLRKLWGLLLLSPGACAVELHAQSRDYNVAVWQTEDGLSQNSVTSIVQTPDGYLWLATFNGLVRFDGARFTVFDEANTPALQSSRLTRLDVDQDGGLWIITEDGALARLRDGRFRSFTAQEGLPPAGAAAMICGPQGRVLLLDREGSVYCLNGERWVPDQRWAFLRGNRVSLFADGAANLWVWFQQKRSLGRIVGDQLVFLKRPDGMEDAEVREFARSRDGGLWLVISNKVWHYQYQPEEWKPTAWALPESVHGLTQVLEDRHGNLWVGTYGHGLLRFGPPGSSERFVAGEGLSHNAVRALWEDREGSLWVGTDGGGLNRLKPRLVTMCDVRHGLSAEVVMAIAQDQGDPDALWLGINGGGVNRLRRGQITPLIVEPVLRSNAFVYGVLADRQGGVWIGTYDQGIFRYHEGRLTCLAGGEPWAGRPLLAGLEDRAGAIWLGGGFGLWRWQDGQLTNLNSQVGWSNVVVRALAEDRAGNVYVGSFGRGLSRCRRGQWTHYSEKDGLADNHTSALCIDREDTLWIGTFNGGLSRFKNDRFVKYTVREGLLADSIASIVEDDYGHLWLGSNRGLFRVRKEQLNGFAEGHGRMVAGYSYGLSDGLSTLECGGGAQPGACKSPDGKLWFATARGVAVVDPGNLTSNPLPPPVVIEEVVMDDRLVSGQWSTVNGEKSEVSRAGAATGFASSLATRHSSLVTVPPRIHRVEFRFTGLSLVAPEKVRFRYRLDNFDDDWAEAGTRRTAYYTKIPPGRYQFRATACNNDGVWNETGATVGLLVLPPWWMTWWFRLLGVLAVSGAFFGWYELRLRHVKRERTAQEAFSRQLILSQENERKRIAGELHDGLGQNLVLIRNRAELGLRHLDPPVALAEQLQEISKAAAQSLEEVRTTAHALRPYELERLGLTRAIEDTAQKAAETSAVKFSCAVENIDGLFPPETEITLFRIVQEGINNLLRHARASEAILEIKKEPHRVHVTLLDNGCGFDCAAATAGSVTPAGFGLANIAGRARMIGGELHIRSAPGRGTALTVQVPLRREAS